MLDFLVRRLATLLLTAWCATLLVFAVLELVPGDPAQIMLGMNASPDAIEALRHQLGLDRPLAERYLRWVGGLLTGDLGTSLTYARPVLDLVLERLPVTAPLALMALIFSVLVGIPAGLWAASRQGRAGDWAVISLAQLGIAIPGFWFAILMILAFSVQLGWFPAGGFPGWEAGLWPATRALAMPAMALALPEAAILARIVRSASLETMREDYVRTARAKGVSRRLVLVRHVLPNALIPVSTIIGLQFAFLIAGAVVIENVFTLPGLGRLLYQAVGQHDLITVQSVVVMLAIFVVAVNALVDVVIATIDPRPRVDA